VFTDVFADISIWQLGLVVIVALVASIIGGVAGYGTGALMPLVLVPIIGPEPVVPIIAMSALLTNGSRVAAFKPYVDWRRFRLVLAAAVPPCILSAWGYTMLTTKGAMLVIGTMLILTVPLRYAMRRRRTAIGDRGLLVGAAGYGAAVGGTVGSGAILISVLMAAGLQGAAVIATDAAISLIIGMVRVSVFAAASAIDARTIAFAVLIGAIAAPGAYFARALVERMPLRLHTAILDAVVVAGGVFMVAGGLMR
jgi:uncharacterized membrane protein YfcA